MFFRKITDYTYICTMIFATKIRLGIATIALMFLCVELSAQQQGSALRFGSSTIDLGHIREEGGVARCDVDAINGGKDTIYIKEILTTCGCTTAKIERERLAPCDTLHLSVQYDPMNRPGRIDKSLYVAVSDCEEPLRLHIVGYVQPRERTIDELYPFDMGAGLRLKSNFHAFSYLEHGKELEERIGYINTSDEELRLTLQPQEVSSQLQVYGVLEDRFAFIVNGQASHYPFGCQVVAVDNFDLVDDISAPRADISKKIIKFGDVKRSCVTMEQSVELINVGSSPLILRAVAVTSEALSVVQESVEVASGERREIVVRLDVSKIEDWDNPFVARLMLITNDPMRPMLSLRVNALPE